MFRRETSRLRGLVQGLGLLVAVSLGSAAGQRSPFTEEALARGVGCAMALPSGSTGSGFGCGFADLDGDRDADIVILGQAQGLVGLFENDGTGQFLDRSLTSGLAPLVLTAGFCAGDYDRDGDPDLYITRLGPPNVLARNDGGFQLTDVASAAGVTSAIVASQSASFGDYDGDGWLDLYVANYFNLGGDGRNDLYRNQGDGTFEDVSAIQGVDDRGYGFQAVWFDSDLDGDVDLYLSNDKHKSFPNLSNRLWRNDGGQLVNVSDGSGADVGISSMGVGCGDVDGNGLPDLYCTNEPGAGGLDNVLLLNLDGDSFIDVAPALGVDNPLLSWSAILFDYDNDTLMDLYVNNESWPNTFYVGGPAGHWPELAGPLGIGANGGSSYSSAVADVDRDGDLDLLVNNLGANVELFINHEGEKRHWLEVDVRDREGLAAVNARVEARVGSAWLHREVLAGGNGFKGQNELVLHFGLGDASVVHELVVTWPGGAPVRRLTHVAADQLLVVEPPPRDRTYSETQVEK